MRMRHNEFFQGAANIRQTVCRGLFPRRDGVDLVSRWVLRGRERGVSNTLLVDQRVYGRRDRIGLGSAVESSLLRCRAAV